MLTIILNSKLTKARIKYAFWQTIHVFAENLFAIEPFLYLLTAHWLTLIIGVNDH